MAVGVARQIRVWATAGRYQGEAGTVVGVGGEATVFGGGADRYDVWRARRVGDRAVPLVAGGGHDEDVVAVRVAQRLDQLRDVGGGHAGRELEAEVDHAGAVADGEIDAFGDRRGFSF